MSAVSTAPRTRKESRVQFALLDWKTITKRNLLTYIRKPDLLVFSTIQPVMFGKLFLGFLMVILVGYSFTWVAAFAGLSLKTVEAVQASTFTLVFPLVFASSAFVPDTTFPTWLQAWSHINPVSIWAETFRALTLGDLYT